MEKRQVIVLGGLPLATRIAKIVLSSPRASLVGVVASIPQTASQSANGEEPLFSFAQAQGIPNYDLETVSEMNFLDLAISARYNQILPLSFIEKFTLGVVNCHGGFLPDYKGVGGHIFPILNGESHSGATLHWMDDGVDDGDIIDRLALPISREETGFTLFNRINEALFYLIDRSFGEILNGTAPRIPQDSLSPGTRSGKSLRYFKRDIDFLYRYPAQSEIARRALHWPMHRTGLR